MGDLMTGIEKKGAVRGKKVVMSWAYAKSYTKPLSLPQSVIELFTQFGADVVLAHPPEFELMPELLDNAANNAHKAGGSFNIVYDMDEAFVDADIVYPKSWGPLVTVEDPSKMVDTIRQYEHSSSTTLSIPLPSYQPI